MAAPASVPFCVRRLALLLLASAFCGPASGEVEQFKFSTGFDYSSGKYDDDKRTTILYVPYRVGYQRGNYTGQIAVSWLSIDGPGTVVGGGEGGVVLPGQEGDTSRESGVGDTWLSLAYEIDRFPYELGYLEVTGKLKIPTADEDKGLGTGEVDYKLQFDYMYSIDRLTPLVTAAYTIKGDPDEGNLDNVFYFSAGADWRQNSTVNVGATLDYQQASVSGVEDPLDFFSYLSYKYSPVITLTPYLYIGLSKGSPDMGGGIQLTYKPKRNGESQ